MLTFKIIDDIVRTKVLVLLKLTFHLGGGYIVCQVVIGSLIYKNSGRERD